jgi:glycerate 2-kinase
VSGGVRERRRHAAAILRAAIAAADPGALVRRALHGAPELTGGEPIHLLAAGKAAAAMAEPLFEAFGDRIVKHVIVLPHGTPTRRPALFGSHPVPDASSEEAAAATAELLERAGAGDLVVALFSGGGSSVVAAPLPGIDIAGYAASVARLMRGGAEIGELNVVRKHIDALKGGRMAALAAPAAVLCLVLSDVVGDRVDVIASGPFSPDPTSAADALGVLRRHGPLRAYPTAVRELLENDAAAGTPQPGAAAFERVRVRVIGGNDVAVEGAARRAAELGYRVHRAVHPVTGPAADAGVTLAREARLLQRAGVPPACIVAGGETTVAVTGAGRGGRNQELVLAACLELQRAAGITVASIGTDGIDGPTEAAGAIADEESLDRAAARGVQAAPALRSNDSHEFHRAAGGLVITGPTGTNVNDVQLALIAAPVPPSS